MKIQRFPTIGTSSCTLLRRVFPTPLLLMRSGSGDFPHVVQHH